MYCQNNLCNCKNYYINFRSEALKKYLHANKVQDDKSEDLIYIEVCKKGYAPRKWLSKVDCIPTCDNCQNGFCVAPNQCKCFDDFVPNDNGDCVFTCPLGCLNGRCYLDGTCQCDPGYKLDETRKFCRPICSGGCGNLPSNNCTAPEVCGCSKGFQLTDEGCKPICIPDCGPGGICGSDNICKCNSDHTLIDGVCQANCYQ